VSLSLLVMRVLADHVQVGVAGTASVPLGLAFGAGVLSTLNPCGFALLPAYVSYAVEQQLKTTSDRQPSGWQHLLRGGLLGLPLAAGFLLVFLVAGGALALGGRLLVHLFPWLAVLIGTGLVLLGGWTLFTGRAPEIPGLGAVATKLGPSRAAGSAMSETLVQTPPRALRAAWIFGVG
jgi:cytochrome c-type biogenesis protein